MPAIKPKKHKKPNKPLSRTSQLRDKKRRLEGFSKSEIEYLINKSKHPSVSSSVGYLLSRGLNARRLKVRGIDAFYLVRHRFSAEELKLLGFSARELYKAGYNKSRLRRIGFSDAEIEDEGYSAKLVKPHQIFIKAMLASGNPQKLIMEQWKQKLEDDKKKKEAKKK